MLASLLYDRFLLLNQPAIAAAESQYNQMWAQDVGGGQVRGHAMSGSADAAARLRLLLTALAQIGAPGEADEPAPYSAAQLDQVEVGLHAALAELTGLRAQTTAG